MFVFSRAGFLSLTSSDPGKNATNQNVTKKENQLKQIVFWSLFFCPPLLFTDTDSENESVKSFPVLPLFDQIKLCVPFDWNWIVVIGQWEGKISKERSCTSSIFDFEET